MTSAHDLLDGGDDPTNIDQAGRLNIEWLVQFLDQRRENFTTAIYFLDPSEVRRIGILAAVAVNLVTPFRQVINVHGIHVSADEKQHGCVVFPVLRSQPKPAFTHDFGLRYRHVADAKRQFATIQVALDLLVIEDRACAVGSFMISHLSRYSLTEAEV